MTAAGTRQTRSGRAALAAEQLAAGPHKPRPVKLKTCTKCERRRRAASFHKSAASPDGLSYRCRACTNADANARYAPIKAANAKQREAEADADLAEWRKAREAEDAANV